MTFDSKKDYVILYKKQTRTLFRLINYGVLNLKISKKILFGSKEVESYVFFLGYRISSAYDLCKSAQQKDHLVTPVVCEKNGQTQGKFS